HTPHQRPLPKVQPWEQIKTLALEKEALGFHVSGHPLDLHEQALRRLGAADVRTVSTLADKKSVRLGGVLAHVRTRIVRSGPRAGQKMAVVTIADKSGAIEAVIFSDPFARYGRLIRNDAIVALIGKVDRSRGEPQVIVEQVIRIEEVAQQVAARIELDLIDEPQGEPLEGIMRSVEDLLRRATGNGGGSVEVLLHLHTNGIRVALRPHGLRVTSAPDLIGTLKQTLGPDHVRVISRDITQAVASMPSR
ncbi:MAG: OB-fold nucleic acid binding domain-containing protein, partial [Planctomycetota bacterium]|nr:OB-fold nucleic acid binding domain-containing protein [Planctomycetota bacterium]